MTSDMTDIEAWMEQRWMGRFSNVLLENNYTDLAKIRACSDIERQKILTLFDKPGHRLKMRLLLEELVKTQPAQMKIEDKVDVPIPDGADGRRKSKWESESDSSHSGRSSPEVPETAQAIPVEEIRHTQTDAPATKLPPFPDSEGEDSSDSEVEMLMEPDVHNSSTSLPTSSSQTQLPVPADPTAATATAVAPPSPVVPAVASTTPPLPVAPIAGASVKVETGPIASKLPPPPTPPGALSPTHTAQNPSNELKLSSSGSFGGGSIDGRPRQSSAIRRRQEAFLKSAQQTTQPASKPAVAVTSAAAPSDAFKNRAAMMGAALQASIAKGPPVFKKKLEQGAYQTQYQAPEEPEEEVPPPEPILRVPSLPEVPVYSPSPPDSRVKGLNEVLANAGAIPLFDDDEDEMKLPPLASLGAPDKAGYLEKRGVEMLNMQWKSRYFLLKGPELYWLKKKEDKMPAGCVHLTEPGLFFSASDDRTMEIHSQRKTYVLRAKDAHEMSEWYNAMRSTQANFVDQARPAVPPVSRKSQAPPPPLSPMSPRNVPGFDDNEVKRLVDIVKAGNMFIKFKHKKGQDRMVWCPNSLDRVVWGDGHDKKKIKGYILVADMVRISDGCFGSKRNENAFTIVSSERNLELEASSAAEKHDWTQALNYLIACRKLKA